MLKLYGKKNKKLTVDLSTVNELKENDKILIASNGKMKQIDQDLVNIGGGGGSTPSMPIVGDGKTRLYVTVASMDRPVISINFGCTVVGGVTIDWGDGSDTEVTTSTERTRYSHSYSAAGDYIIVLEVTEGELILEGGEDDGGYRGITQAFAEEEIPYTLSYNCSTLKMVEIGSGVTSIGNYTFYNCNALTSIVIPSSVTSIGDNAFNSCSDLTSVVIPSSVTSIGDYAFYNCYSLTSIVIPEGVTSIGEGTFCECYSLTSIVIPEGVTSIGNEAFQTCSALTSVVIPEGVTSIGSYAFSYCPALTSIVIPSSVTSIGDQAFTSCSSLTSITIPSSVTSIQNETFMDCTSLGGIHFLSSTPPALESGSFDSVPEDCKIYIPTGSLGAYGDDVIWGDYASMLVEE